VGLAKNLENLVNYALIKKKKKWEQYQDDIQSRKTENIQNHVRLKTVRL
jgi:hypothetical protein